jgi:hypothetical protein
MKVEIPDNVRMADLLSALRKVGLRPKRRHPLEMERLPNHVKNDHRCGADGCRRAGVIQWEDGGPCYCADHAWSIKR